MNAEELSTVVKKMMAAYKHYGRHGTTEARAEYLRACAEYDAAKRDFYDLPFPVLDEKI